MTARETLLTKFTNLRRRADERGRITLPAGAVALGMETAISFLLAAVLAGATLGEDCAPFGTALVGAAGAGLPGAGALIGACFGALSTLGFSQGLRRASAAILTFAVAFAFYDAVWFARPWIMPLVAGAVDVFTGAVVQSQLGWTPQDVVRLTLEGLLTAAATWGFRAALERREEPSPGSRAGSLLLVCALLTALAPLSLYRDISLGRILAGMAAMAAAWQGGPSAGAILGVAAGAALDLSGADVPRYAMAWGLAGLTCGLCRGRGRLAAGLTFCLTAGAAVLWSWELNQPLPILYETALALPLFLLLPRSALGWLGSRVTPGASAPSDPQARRLARQKLESTARAFRTLNESLQSAFRPPRNDNDVAAVFHRAAGRVCRNCRLCMTCWLQDYTATFGAMNDATPAMVERGRAEAGDFPPHFAHRCLYFPAYLGAVNEELTALFYRRQYNARVGENRAAVCRQYAQLSDLLGAAAAELSRELTPDPAGDRRLRQFLDHREGQVRGAVYRDSRGLVRVELEGPGCADLSRPSRIGELSRLLALPLRLEREGEGFLSLLQQEPLMAVAGVAARRKTGETVSGDTGTYFKRADGKLYVLLCDGMGSGPEANRESSLATRLLEEFLQAGVEAKAALTTLSSALALRGEETGGFTTVDLLQVDLFSGECRLFKLGAAPTYIKKGGAVQRLTGSSLPAGLGEGDDLPMDQFSLKLEPGDTVLMVSDGVCGGGEDGWLQERLAQFDGSSPKELARTLLTEGPQDAADDRTALVIRMETRPTGE